MKNLFFNAYNLVSNDYNNPNLYFMLDKDDSDIGIKFLSSSIDKNLVSKKVSINFSEEMSKKIYSKINQMIEENCCSRLEFSLIKTSVTNSGKDYIEMNCNNIVIKNGSFVSEVLAN